MLEVLKQRGFIAFIAVAFINAFVDLGHKIIVQNTLFKIYDGSEQVILTAIVNALILLPFILLFSPAGSLSDRLAKPWVMRVAALGAVVLTLLITWSYYQGWFEMAFAMTLALAIQSALYSPAKFGYIRELLGQDKLSEGNGWAQAASMVAILSGIVAFSLMFESRLAQAELTPTNTSQVLLTIAPLGWLLVAGSVLEALLAFRLPIVASRSKAEPFEFNKYIRGQLLRENISLITNKRAVFQAILGVSVFWTISQVMLAVFPSFAEASLGVDNTFVIQGVMALAGIGIMTGSALAGRASRHHINLGLVPVGAIGVALGLLVLVQLESLTVAALVFFLIGLSGALLTIPLNALIQFHANEHNLGKILAGNNFIQNIAMLCGLIATVVLSLLSVSELWLLWALVVVAMLGAAHAIRTLPQALARLLVAFLFNRKYRIQVQGFEHLKPEGQGMLLLGNHISWIDWGVIQLACPRPVRFVMERAIYQRWYLRWFLDMFKVIPIARGKSEQALETVREALENGEVVCLFPEGMISHTGQLSEFKRGFERAAKGCSAQIVPFYLRGLWGSRFSRSTSRVQELRSRGGGKRDLIVAFGAPMSCDSSAAEVKQRVFELSISAWNGYTDQLPSLGEAFIDSIKHSRESWLLTDVDGTPLSRNRLLAGVLMMRQSFVRSAGENLGLLLPTTAPGVMANMAALLAGKTLVNLNFTAAPEAFASALSQAQIKTVVSSRKFVKKLAGRGIEVETLLAGCEVIYLEDLVANTSRVSLFGFLARAVLLPSALLKLLYCKRRSVDDTAAILFSSGSEGAPKGVMLSHRNCLANLKQIGDVLNLREDDRVMASLPLFHAFGLTVTCLMPMIEGVPLVCQPDPTDALSVGKGVAKFRATVLCATGTFLGIYSRSRKLQPMMFESLRVVVAGAEKLSDEVREQFESRFHKTILEGYGCTETTPVASVNLPDYLNTQWWVVQRGNKLGSVGMALPGSMFRIVDPESLEQLPAGQAGLILIGGTQIMKGYLNDEHKTRQAIVEIDGIRWYKSGDKGVLDDDGFLTILDRYSRFAKVGGEMVGLGEVEQQVRKRLPTVPEGLAAVALPDVKKGERIVLLATKECDAASLRSQLVSADMPNLLLPAKVFAVEQIPLLGSGKVDLAGCKQLALAMDSAT